MKSQRVSGYLASCAIAVVLAGCGREEPAHSSTAAAEQSAASKASELEAREQQLAQREAEIKAREEEQEQQRRAEAEAAEREASKAADARKAAEEAAAKRAAAKKAAATRATAAAPVARNTSPAPAPVHAPVEVRAGTQLVVALATDVSTKTAKVGDPFEARLTAPLLSGDRVVAPQGARVTGTITEVVSGSSQIGAVPTLGLSFDQLELLDDRHAAIHSELQQTGDSEKVSDTAKIVGGAAAGAVIGHQIKHGNKGKVIGGILGGAAGALIAKNTGSEVEFAAGSQLTITLEQGFVVP